MSNIKSKSKKKKQKTGKSPVRKPATVTNIMAGVQNRLNKAIDLHRSGKLSEAAQIYEKIIERYPHHGDALHLLGLTAYQSGKYEKAVDLISKAIGILPDNPIFHTNLGIVHQSRNRYEDARVCYDKAFEIKPDHAEAIFHTGNIWLSQGNPEKAIEYYQKTIAIQPEYADAHNNMGNALKDLGQTDRALECYQQVLKLRPKSPEAHNNMGNILKEKGELDRSIACYLEALKLNSNYAQAYYNLGFAYKEKGDLDQAVVHYCKALDLKPDYDKACSSLVHQWQHLCQWQDLPEMAARLDSFTKESLAKGIRPSETPFENITRHDDVALNQRLAVSWSHHIAASVQHMKKNLHFRFERKSKDKLTIGYLSNDYYNHPTAHLMLSLFGLHNREKFRVFCYSYGKDDQSFYRKKIEQDCDKFTDIRDFSHADAAKAIYNDNVDILVDLKGHTTDNRLEICALRPAPIQLTYLGFPGTTGADFFDYMITDHMVTPEEHIPYYTENPVFMPNCYQINDHQQPVSERDWKRSDFGLPEKSFVFCSFNISYKIDPQMFDVWMRILHQVPDSVLWLLHRNETVDNNLKNEAKKRGISARRILFAQPFLKNEHLKRMKLANLALDTRIVNGHTTTSDALWAGVPVIALQGRHFASRVSSSILTAMDLPELITKNLEEYESFAVRLAHNSEELTNIREKIAQNRADKSLFDTPGFVKDLEKAYEKMHQLWLSGEKPCRMEVAEDVIHVSFSAEKQVETFPDDENAQLKIALDFHHKGDLAQAEAIYRSILKKNPKHSESLHLLGLIAYRLGKYDTAEKLIRMAIRIHKTNPVYFSNLGLVLHAQGRSREADSCYKKTVSLYEESLQRNPGNAEEYYNLAVAYKEKENLEQAVVNYRKSLEMKPDYDLACASLVHQLQLLCDWPVLAEMSARLDRFTKESLAGGRIPAEPPFGNITRHEDAERNYQVAKAWSDYLSDLTGNIRKQISFDFPRTAKDKLIIGYVSNDFCNHPVAHLILSMFGLHNRERFRVFCYSYGRDDQSIYRRKIEQDCDKFVDIQHLSHADAAKMIYADGVDILVDLKGYTSGSRLEICAIRPAPVQVTWLGFPGAAGADFFDYILTDRIVTPEEHLDFYRENPVYMPHCYLISDDHQPISEKECKRADFGLPEKGFVFCSFNMTYKIEPVMFDVWMRILHQIPDSVLWLRQRNETVEKNIRMEAEKRGISRDRIIFAELVFLKNEHLKRMQLADLVLDTRIVNGHTTTIDALWAGVPVLTLQGRHFASRVSSSILTAIELPELITHSLEEYESLAVRLACNPDELSRIRQKIVENRVTKPLFDTPRFVRDLERAYEKMHELWLSGEKPCRMRVEEDKVTVLNSKKKLPDVQEELKSALAFHQKGELTQAEALYRNILKKDPQHSQTLHLLGVIAYQTGKYEEAENLIRNAIRIHDKDAGYFSNLGLVLQAQARFAEAHSCYEKALSLRPNFAEAHNNMGNAFQDQGEYDKALSCYHKALELKPAWPEAHNHIGLAYQAQGKYPDALAAYQKAVECRPDFADAYYNMATVLHLMGKLDEAVECCDKTLSLQPDHAKTYNIHIFQLQQICDWEKLDRVCAQMEQLTEKELKKGNMSPEQPLTCVTRCDDSARNYAVAKSWANDIRKRMAKYKTDFSFENRKKNPDKLTIGYLSGDFQNHATAHLMLSLFGLHSREEFKIFCYSYGKDDGTFYRTRIKTDADQFVDISPLNHMDAAKRMYQDQVDILVDLKGHTKDNRLEICALRPAPVIAAYLGFPGTTGADFIDYAIVDKIVAPREHAQYFSEKLMYLPNSYQVNDFQQPISEKQWQKADFGLPEHAFVFCSFNQSYKIESVMFTVWMNILRRVPDSVLWLLKAKGSGEKNLKAEAVKRGVEPERLIFAESLPKDEHLARIRLADLFLDTRIVNGHTTSSDALWAGVPLIALEGKHFASRVSSSLLQAIGMPELITHSPEDYERLAVRLARNPSQLEAIRKKLSKNRLTEPLFDTRRFARNLEKVYKEMWKEFVQR